MDINDILKSHETRILDLEVTCRDHEGKIAKLDDKTESAWHRIRETQQEGLVVVNEDVKVMKSQQKSDSLKMKVIILIVSVSLVISIGFFIYIWRHDRELAKELLSFGMTAARTVGV